MTREQMVRKMVPIDVIREEMKRRDEMIKEDAERREARERVDKLKREEEEEEDERNRKAPLRLRELMARRRERTAAEREREVDMNLEREFGLGLRVRSPPTQKFADVEWENDYDKGKLGHSTYRGRFKREERMNRYRD